MRRNAASILKNLSGPLSHTVMPGKHPLHFFITEPYVLRNEEKTALHCFTRYSDTIIQWNAAEEKTNRFYTVEKSEDGRIWVPVSGQIKAGSGNYSFIDKYNQSSLCWYRIKIGKMFGKDEYSDSFELKSPYAPFRLKIKPDPVKAFLYLEINDTSEHLAEVYIQNLLGKILYSEVNITGKTHLINTSHFPAGYYYLKVVLTSGECKVKRFEKQR